MLSYGLGRFGDRRLEKGGPSCMPAWSRRVVEGCVFAVLAGIGLGRSA
jgi:reverse gyrase